jgi:hypothetical protein
VEEEAEAEAERQANDGMLGNNVECGVEDADAAEAAGVADEADTGREQADAADAGRVEDDEDEVVDILLGKDEEEGMCEVDDSMTGGTTTSGANDACVWCVPRAASPGSSQGIQNDLGAQKDVDNSKKERKKDRNTHTPNTSALVQQYL